MRKPSAILFSLCLVVASCGSDDAVESPTAAPAAITTSAAPTSVAPPSTTTTSTTTTTTTEPPETTTTTTTTVAPHPAVVGELSLGSKPCALEIAPDGTAWSTMIGSGELIQIDPKSGEALNTISTGPGACGLAIADGKIFVGDTSTNSVFWLDLESGSFLDRLQLDGPPWDVQTIGDLVWVAVRRSGDVVAIDPAGGRVVFEAELGVSALSGVALSEGTSWIASESTDVVYRIDQATGEITEVEVSGSPSWFAETDGAVWVSQAANRTVSKIDTATGEPVLEVEVGREPLDLAAGFGSVWVPNRADGTITRIDAITGELIDTYPLAPGIYVAEVVGDEVWVLDFSGTTIFRIDPAVTR